MWNIGLIEDPRLLLQAYEWQQALPRWLQQSARFCFDSAEDLSKDLEKGYNFLAQGDKGSAIIHGERIGFETYEGHLFCQRAADPDLVTAGIVYGTKWVFENSDAKHVVSMVRLKHRGLRRIVENAGFTRMGYEMWKGSVRNNRIFATEMYVAFKG